MQVIEDLGAVHLNKDSALTIGTFDGVHLGHQFLIQKMVAQARSTDRLAGILTFEPKPRAVLYPQELNGTLTSTEERLRLIERLGVDFVAILAFTRELAQTSAEEFIRWVQARLRMKELWVGPDFRLGRDREGDVPHLRWLGRKLGFEVQVVEPFQVAGQAVSSTRIRALLREGRVREAKELLGRYPTYHGRVISGARRGHRLGFPTANIALDRSSGLPQDGVYAVRVTAQGRTYPGVTNVGLRPTFDGQERLLEVHILDFQGDLYGEELGVEFVERLREERRFANGETLAAQLSLDVERARQILAQE